jgi:hypothetical protein
MLDLQTKSTIKLVFGRVSVQATSQAFSNAKLKRLVPA